MATHRRTRDTDKERFWLSAFERYGASGLSKNQFCAQERLSQKSFYYWYRRYREGKLGKKYEPPASRPTAAENLFVPVRVTEDSWSSRRASRPRVPIEIFSPTGFVVRVPVDASEDVLASVLAALSRSGC